MLPLFSIVLVVYTVDVFSALSTRNDLPFRNVSLPWKYRVEDLVQRLSLEEVILQLSKGGAGKHGGPAPGISRLGIKPYSWNTECLRGDVEAGNATSFPQAIGLAASFSAQLVYDVSKATSTEVRAKHNDYARKGHSGDHTGLSCFSPVINIMRHPLWGRNQETYGEDPTLSGVLAEYFVNGLQGSHPRYIRANAGCKHFDVHGGPENLPVSRLSFNAEVSERDWRLTFLPQFKKCVHAGTYSLMCSYNRINGIPACANKRLLTDILRNEWNFNGYVVSDEGAIENMIKYHKYFTDATETAAASVKAGTNLELSSDNPRAVFLQLGQAVSQGKISKETIFNASKPLFYTRMRLGEFDPPHMNPYTKLDLSVIQSPEHQELSIIAAMKSFVLLKNDENFLPLKSKLQSLAVVGPMGNNTAQLFGDYSPDADRKFVLTPLQGLSQIALSTKFASGCNDSTICLNYDGWDVQQAVRGTDMAIVCLGTGQEIERENHDRNDMSLPGKQLHLLADAIKHSPGRVILLVFSAGPLDITLAQNNPKVSAIFQCFFPAQATGEALRRVLIFSHHGANPAGRLPYTWYASMDQVAPMVNYSMVNRTYRYFEGTPLYPFGYGLSYTRFQYLALEVTPKIHAGQNVTLRVTLQNTGIYRGDEVVQVYIAWENSTRLRMPRLQLAGFQRIHLKVQETVSINFTISANQMAIFDDKTGFIVRPGVIGVFAGGQQPNQKMRVPSNILHSKFVIV